MDERVHSQEPPWTGTCTRDPPRSIFDVRVHGELVTVQYDPDLVLLPISKIPGQLEACAADGHKRCSFTVKPVVRT